MCKQPKTIKTLDGKTCVLLINDEFPAMSYSEWVEALTNGMDIHVTPEVVTKGLERYFVKSLTTKVRDRLYDK